MIVLTLAVSIMIWAGWTAEIRELYTDLGVTLEILSNMNTQ